MKLWKRLTAVAMALTMSASVCALAGCGEKEPSSNNGGTENSNNTENSEGTSAVSKITSALENQELETVIFNYVQSRTDIDVTKSLETGEVTQSGTWYENFDVTVKANIDDGNIDAVQKRYIGYNYEYTNAPEKNRYSHSEDIDYIFVRNGQSFTYDTYDHTNDPEEELDLEVLSDFSGVTLNYAGDFEDNWLFAVPSYYVDWFDSYETKANIMLLNLADVANAVTVESDKAVIDVNKLAYNAIIELSEAFNTFTADTPVSEILKNATVKKYLSAIINSMSKDEITDLLYTFLPDNPYLGIISLAINGLNVPKNATTYDYLVAAVESTEVMSAVGGAFEGLVELPEGGLVGATLGLIIGMIVDSNDSEDIRESLEYAKTYLAELSQSATPTEFVIDIAIGPTAIKNAKIEYTLNSDSSVAAQTYTFDAIAEDTYTSSYNQTETVETERWSYSGNIEYTSQKATLADISNNVVEADGYIISDGTYTDTGWITSERYDYKEDEWITDWYECAISFTVENGQLKNYTVTGEDGNVLPTDGTPFTIAGLSDEYKLELYIESFFNQVSSVSLYMHKTGSSGTYYMSSFYASSSNERYSEYKCYTNTVAGVLSGADWTLVS